MIALNAIIEQDIKKQDHILRHIAQNMNALIVDIKLHFHED